MKPSSITIVLVSLALLACLDVKGQELLTITNHFETRVWTCSLQQADLAKAPKWDMRSQDHPPLAPGKAMKIAEHYVRRLLGDGPFGEQIGSMAIAATLQAEGLDKWIYVVKVVAGRPGSSGNPPMQIIVMMDGRVCVCNESTE